MNGAMKTEGLTITMSCDVQIAQIRAELAWVVKIIVRRVKMEIRAD